MIIKFKKFFLDSPATKTYHHIYHLTDHYWSVSSISIQVTFIPPKRSQYLYPTWNNAWIFQDAFDCHNLYSQASLLLVESFKQTARPAWLSVVIRMNLRF